MQVTRHLTQEMVAIKILSQIIFSKNGHNDLFLPTHSFETLPLPHWELEPASSLWTCMAFVTAFWGRTWEKWRAEAGSWVVTVLLPVTPPLIRTFFGALNLYVRNLTTQSLCWKVLLAKWQKETLKEPAAIGIFPAQVPVTKTNLQMNLAPGAMWLQLHEREPPIYEELMHYYYCLKPLN